MEMTEIRALGEAELQSRRKEAKQEGFNLRMQKQIGQLEKPSRVKEVRKLLAKIETALSERRLGLKVTSRPGKTPKTSKTAKTEKARKEEKMEQPDEESPKKSSFLGKLGKKAGAKKA